MKKFIAVLSAMATLAGSVPVYACAYSKYTTGNLTPVVDWDKWDDFIKYDLRITDFYSLDREKQNLCKFIFETEMSAEDDIVCERARRILAGQDVGERVTIEKLRQYEAIGDSKWLYGVLDARDYIKEECYIRLIDYYYGLEDKCIFFCVPDIKHVGYKDYNEYWLDDDGTEYITSVGEVAKSAYEYPTYFEYVNKNTNETKSYDFAKSPEYPVISCNEFEFTVYPDNTLSLEKVDYSENNSDVIEIPATVDGMPVRQIASECFTKAPYTEIILPEGLEYIEPVAFKECHNLEKINFPESLKNIGGYAFYECGNLGTLEISCPELITTQFGLFGTCSVDNLIIGTETARYYYCDGYFENHFGNITLLDGVKEIDIKYLQDDMEIPESVTILSGHIYEVKNQLIIPEQIEILGAFDDITPYDPYVSIGDYPDVPLYDEHYSISYPMYITIYGYSGTEAQKYALTHECVEFIQLDSIGDPYPDKNNSVLNGDANGDGKINIADAVLLQRYLLGNVEISGNADVNNDGYIDSFDMVMIRKMLVE